MMGSMSEGSPSSLVKFASRPGLARPDMLQIRVPALLLLCYMGKTSVKMAEGCYCTQKPFEKTGGERAEVSQAHKNAPESQKQF
mmetsp:Transcript_71351/g.167151  ORF Transcript_71351/g.167151 Transcript_71351/m.167151 type:complete len:84 (-) Transcript_71351:689-940(-)